MGSYDKQEATLNVETARQSLSDLSTEDVVLRFARERPAALFSLLARIQEACVSKTDEEIGGRKWSLISRDPIFGVSVIAEGSQEVSVLTAYGKQFSSLLVTAPQLWDAANELTRFYRASEDPTMKSVGAAVHIERMHAAHAKLAAMVAKAVGKDDWKDVAQ